MHLIICNNASRYFSNSHCCNIAMTGFYVRYSFLSFQWPWKRSCWILMQRVLHHYWDNVKIEGILLQCLLIWCCCNVVAKGTCLSSNSIVASPYTRPQQPSHSRRSSQHLPRSNLRVVHKKINEGEREDGTLLRRKGHEQKQIHHLVIVSNAWCYAHRFEMGIEEERWRKK